MTLFEQHHLPCLLESRLSKRYQTIVMEHMTVNSTNAPGAKSLEHHTQSWASTQATWRFYHNDNVTFPMLSSPMNGLAQGKIINMHMFKGVAAHSGKGISRKL